MKIQKATQKDHIVLTEITKKSKAYWDYSEEQLKKWDKELTITEEYIEENEVYLATTKEDTDKIIAYYSFYEEDKYTIVLDNLFVLPDYIGKGYGKLLMADLTKRLKNTKIDTITLNSDPNAEIFYKRMGFGTIGYLETDIFGRFLSIMIREV